MPKLTKRVVDMAVARPAQAFTWDSEVKGFGLRVTPAGVKSYVLSYRDAGGQTRRITIGKHGSPWTCETARTRAIEALRGLTDGIDPRAAKIERRTAATVADLVEMRDGADQISSIYLAEGWRISSRSTWRRARRRSQTKRRRPGLSRRRACGGMWCRCSATGRRKR